MLPPAPLPDEQLDEHKIYSSNPHGPDMLLTQETATTIMVGLQAIGTITAIFYGVIRIERRFTRLETNMEWIKKQCPSCKQD